VPGPARRPLADRFREKVDVRGPSDCWPWTGSRLPKGYGSLARGGDGTGQPPLKAHRVAWALARGVDPLTMPEDQVIRHKVCDNPPCCNPDHLEDGTMKDNNADTALRGRAHWQSGRRDHTGRFA
jgi:hypothetical protein